jgi:hypothetical protein
MQRPLPVQSGLLDEIPFDGACELLQAIANEKPSAHSPGWTVGFIGLPPFSYGTQQSVTALAGSTVTLPEGPASATAQAPVHVPREG